VGKAHNANVVFMFFQQKLTPLELEATSGGKVEDRRQRSVVPTYLLPPFPLGVPHQAEEGLYFVPATARSLRKYTHQSLG
jgi:hypothetical protein